MKTGKIVLTVGIVLIAVIGIWWWQASSPAKKVVEKVAPEMEVISVHVSNLDQDRVDATAEIELGNPLPADIKTKKLSYEIYVDSIKIIEDDHEQPVDIAESDSEVIELPMEVLADPLQKVFRYFEANDADSATYAINLSFDLDVPIEGQREINLDFSKDLPTFQLMDFKLQNFDPNILSSDEGIDLVVTITNPNHYPLKLENGSFYLTVEDELEVSGQLEELVNIPANGKEDVAIKAKKERGSITQSALSYLFDQEGTNFHYVFSYTVDSENEMFNNTEMESVITGTLDEITGAF